MFTAAPNFQVASLAKRVRNIPGNVIKQLPPDLFWRDRFVARVVHIGGAANTAAKSCPARPETSSDSLFIGGKGVPSL